MIDEFVSSAESYVGTRYQHQGRAPGLGLDCAGVVVCAARAAGVYVEDVDGYSPNPSALQLIKTLQKHCDEVFEESPKNGDILVFAWDSEPQHVAVYMDGGYIVHAYAAARRCVKHNLSEDWSARITNIFRLKQNG